MALSALAINCTLKKSGAACYWVGEAIGKTHVKDLDAVPDKVSQTAAVVASNAAHMAELLARERYPGTLKPSWCGSYWGVPKAITCG